jgi:membrane fusion protein (multidrug efflux system)
MKKRMTIMSIALVLVFGGIFAWNGVRAYFMKQYFAHAEPPTATVSSTKARQANWQAKLSSVGSLAALDGIDIKPEASGIITALPFSSGQMVKKGELLVKLDDRLEQAQLLNDLAEQKLAKINFTRYQDLYRTRAEAKSKMEEADAKLQQANAAVAKTQVLLSQKNIVAPFDGKIGIKLADAWQFINAGTSVVTLQAIDTLKVNFSLPEQDLPLLAPGQKVAVKVAPFAGQEFTGIVTAINAKVDSDTHNILIQATLGNKEQRLLPGLFADVSLYLTERRSVVVIPEVAIDFSLFGDSVYVIRKTGTSKDGKPILTVQKRFVQTGDRQDNMVIINKGLKADEEVVTSGQLKLMDNARVNINNKVQPI